MKRKILVILPIIIIILIIFFGVNYLSNFRNLVRPNIVLPSALPYKTVSCPSGFIKVPGNAFYKTQDFCVMKYDAKCTNTNPKCITVEGVYKNNLPGCECQDGYKIVSKPDGAPVTFIPEISNDGVNAKYYCQKEGWHLMTNPEWMTIAMNAASINLNWCDRNGTNCGNKPGSPGKILANGHNDSFPAKALESGNDSLPCYLTSNDMNSECGSPGSQKRTLTLSNDEVIWDFQVPILNSLVSKLIFDIF